MSTRENVRLIARCSYCPDTLHCYDSCPETNTLHVLQLYPNTHSIFTAHTDKKVGTLISSERRRTGYQSTHLNCEKPTQFPLYI